MAKVSTNINLDVELKKNAQSLFADFGMDLTIAVTVFLKKAVREQKFLLKLEEKSQMKQQDLLLMSTRR